MPPQNPPTGQEIADTVRNVHDAAGNTALTEHGWLKQIVSKLTVGSKPNVPWEMLKMLRVVRLSLEYGIPAPDALAGFPKEYYEFLADPRLSRVAAASGISLVASESWHLDLDWFGPAGTNWWAGGVTDGKSWQKEVARGFTHWLEDSFGVDRSDPHPSTWKWAHGADSAGSPWDDLKVQRRPQEQNPPGPAPGPLAIEWRAAKSETAMEVSIQKNGKLQINTGRVVGGIDLP